MSPHYYLMKNKKILRLEADEAFTTLEADIKARALDPLDMPVLDQDQANWRVVIFRDEIMDLVEYKEWLAGAAFEDCEEEELELIAN